MSEDLQSPLREDLLRSIKQSMKDKNITQASMGDLLGVDQSRVAQILNDGKGLTGLLRIAKILEIDVSLNITTSN